MSGLPRDRGQFGLGAVSQQDIQAFRTSISARRFPALREMRDEDIAALVVRRLPSNKQRHLLYVCIMCGGEACSFAWG